MPLSRPGLVTLGIVNTLWVWNELLIAIVFLQRSDKRTLMAGLTLFQGEFASNIPAIMAGLTIAVAAHVRPVSQRPEVLPQRPDGRIGEVTVTFVLPVVIVFLAGILTGVTGFGFSVLSVPLLLLVFQPHEVVVMALCLVPVTSAVLLLAPGLRGQVRQRTFGALTAFSVVGLPVGILLFEQFDPMWVTA